MGRSLRIPLALYLVALAARAIVMITFPDPAYPDSYYYADVARAIASGHGLNVDFIWIFAEVGNKLPNPAVLPIPSNAHWLPLASFIQAPFVSLLGPTAFANAIPMILIGSLAAPLTWVIARDAGARPLVATAAGALTAVPGAALVFLAQPENFALLHPLVAATLWLTARGLKGDGRSFAVAGFLAGLAALARNDGVLLAGAVGLIWLADRVRWWRARRGRRGWSRVDDRPPIPVLAGVLALAGFFVVMGPWWARQLLTFGSISPTSSSGAALWITNIRQWNSITANPSLSTWLAQGAGTIASHDLAGLVSAAANFLIFICSVVLLPFLLIGMLARRRSVDFQPWFVYAFVAFAGATFIYPLHVPGGAFIHTAIGLAPHAAILSIEGVLVAVGWVAGRRHRWQEGQAGAVLVWGMVAIVAASSVFFGQAVEAGWNAVRTPRVELAAYLASPTSQLASPSNSGGRTFAAACPAASATAGATPGGSDPGAPRLMTIDAGGFKYFTDLPGVVSPDDSIETIQSVAVAYDICWLVVERDDAASALGPVLRGVRPSWIGAPVFTVPAADGGLPLLALFPVCPMPDPQRCGPGS
jgi:hypothetical protein